ncbi:uncharacterized protein B0I36DRAFT_257296 [Microdochium trichocladiopsis]|uniref:Uncharacterized protein n=1 Tax=Microdochium trichocladiopsis TaxID=1682393 RepID=A0A9P8XRP3_9PEZI|nr:uncharacterized protein B0I36DRAFT_257296 [Microdochium trichocladiopsis]KAH7010778.1 hypothetical protein B0I36DRAFT_257296 [Microdochium trichocladiopsis]
MSKVLSLTTLLVAAASLASASPAAPALLQSRQSCVEGKTKICYGVNGGTSQGLDVEELEYLAAYLRFVGQSNTGINAFYQMPTSNTCQEWAIPLPEGATTLVLAKHVSPFVKSAVLYEDIASTIDGGEGATDAQRAAALMGCAVNGGQMGVAVNTKHEAYASAEFKASKAKADGVVIKLVKVPAAV